MPTDFVKQRLEAAHKGLAIKNTVLVCRHGKFFEHVLHVKLLQPRDATNLLQTHPRRDAVYDRLDLLSSWLGVPFLELLERQTTVMVQIGIFKRLLGRHRGKVLRGHTHRVSSPGLRLVHYFEHGTQIPPHLFQRDEAIPVVIKQRERGAGLVVAGASAQNGQPARKFTEIDHAVAIVIEQIEQAVDDTERRRFFCPT